MNLTRDNCIIILRTTVVVHIYTINTQSQNVKNKTENPENTTMNARTQIYMEKANK